MDCFKRTNIAVAGDLNPSRRDFLRGMGALSLAGFLGFDPLDAGAAAQAPGAAHLQREVNRYVRGLRRAGLVAHDERTAWSVYDFTAGTKLVAINEDRALQGASMIKPFIAQAYFYRHRENRRRYPYDARIKRLMTKMIRYSSNSATNELIDRISRKSARQKPKDVELLLKRNGRGIFRQTRIVEYIPKNGRSYRNRASAHDYSRFLYALWTNRLPSAEELRRFMRLPNKDRIVTQTGDIPPQTQVYDKTGSTARLCGNMGIVAALGRDNGIYPYTFIGIIEKSRRAKNYPQWIKRRGDVIRAVSSLVYRDMKTRHPLI